MLIQARNYPFIQLIIENQIPEFEHYLEQLSSKSDPAVSSHLINRDHTNTTMSRSSSLSNLEVDSLTSTVFRQSKHLENIFGED